MKLFRLFLGLLLCWSATAPGAAQIWAAQKPLDEAVATYQRELRDEGVVGGTVFLVGKQGMLAQRTFGLADKAAGTPISADTLHHWASVTKVFTSIAAMQLVERGLLSLDDPVTRYVPEFASVHNPFGPIEAVTLRHLLTHSAGLRGATFPWNGDGAATGRDWQPHEPRTWRQIAAMMPYTAVQFAPGSRAAYSNLGLTLVGRIVEAISGDSLETYVEKNILKPLGMTRSYFDATPWWLREHRGHSYTLRGGTLHDHGSEIDTGATVANGGLNGPASDMAKFVAFLLGGPTSYPVLQPQTLAAMLEPRIFFQKDPRRTIWVGLGFFLTDETDSSRATRRYFGHSGFQLGHRSSLYLSADGCCGLVFAANTARSGDGNTSASALRVAVVDRVFPQLRNSWDKE